MSANEGAPARASARATAVQSECKQKQKQKQKLLWLGFALGMVASSSNQTSVTRGRLIGATR